MLDGDKVFSLRTIIYPFNVLPGNNAISIYYNSVYYSSLHAVTGVN